MLQLGDPAAVMAGFNFPRSWNAINLQMWSKFNVLSDMMIDITVWSTDT
jgi:hypothetical protein